jgi:hypothetical protein
MDVDQLKFCPIKNNQKTLNTLLSDAAFQQTPGYFNKYFCQQDLFLLNTF